METKISVLEGNFSVSFPNVKQYINSLSQKFLLKWKTLNVLYQLQGIKKNILRRIEE